MVKTERNNQLTALPKWYTPKEALKEAKRQQSMPTDNQSNWEDKNGNKVYFTNLK